MDDQWQNFLRNLGAWQGTFTGLSTTGEPRESTASLLTLEQGAEERLVHFRLRRYGPDGLQSEPIRDNREDYRSLGRQVVFFSTGTFCKGSLQVAPGTVFGGEFGFLEGDRRHRLVQLHRPDGAFDGLVLIREFRLGSAAVEQPPLQTQQLLGLWRGQAETISADWPVAEQQQAELEISTDAAGALQFSRCIGSFQDQFRAGVDRQLLLLADGGYHLTPVQVSHRQAFAVEAGWMPAPGQLQILIRRFDGSGAWASSTLLRLTQA